MRLRVCLLTLFCLSTFLAPSRLCAQVDNSSPKSIKDAVAIRIEGESPAIDGNLDDPVWKAAGFQLAGGFIQQDPDEGHQATESTLVAIIYDDDALYVAFWNYDSEPDRINGQLVRRDRETESDHVAVKIDPFHDLQSGYAFYLNVSGVQRDLRLYNDVGADSQWDAVWEGAARIHPWGWAAEFRIPYHCLRFQEKESHIWGLNLGRYISRKAEIDRWMASPSTEGGIVSRFGTLSGLKGIHLARHLEVLPYAVANAEVEPKHLGNPDGRGFNGNTGVDIKYSLSSNLTLDATVNPDFGQVELDRPVLNLSAFETMYPERRPFFLEGANLFETPFGLFYSRRIGRSPSGGIDDPDFSYTKERPKATTILNATKLSGKLTRRTSVAVLNAVTSEEKSVYIADFPIIDLGTGDTLRYESQTRHGVVENKANYSVLRIQREVLSNSNVGILATLATQDRRYPASTGGLDWRLYTKNGVWGTNGQVVFSRLDDSHTGFGFTGTLTKEAGKHIRGSVGSTIKDPYLNLNRLGFMSRNDYRSGWAWLQYRTQDNWWIIRNSWNNLNYYGAWNYAGDNIENGWNINVNWELLNNWFFGGGFGHDFLKYDDFETRGNGLWKRPHSWNWWASLTTDPRKKITLNFNPGSGVNRNGTWWANYIGVDLRPRSNLEFSVGINYVRTSDATRWVDNGTDTVSAEYLPLFADLDQDEVSLSASASVVLRRNLSLQVSGQGYVSALDYRDVRRYLGGDSYAPLGDIPLPAVNRNSSALNSTMVLRWEYLPGSTLYFVWTRARYEDDYGVHNLLLDRDMRRLFSVGAENVWVLKLSYWWNM